ncbi:MAG: c-type cytochrome [Elusimicrobiota bacterium]|nr:c-type cytochrome [Elusimicrobiota bacterium]
MRLALALVFSLAGAASAAEPSLELRRAGVKERSVALSELKAALSSKKLEFYSPFSKKTKRYEGFALKDLLNLAYGDAWTKTEWSDAAFIALDGYQAVGALAKLDEDGAYLAFRDLDRESGWEPVGARDADPGPFFLVWTKDGQTTENAYPWPWQIAALDLVRFETRYPEVLPAGAKEGSAARRGFRLFKDRCFRCHSINGQGGKVGPDLNAPKSVTEYRSKKMVLEFIRNPSDYRVTQMPDHRDLTARDLEDLYAYLKLKSRQKVKSW